MRALRLQSRRRAVRPYHPFATMRQPGTGLIAALQVLASIVETGKRASEVCRLFHAGAAAVAQRAIRPKASRSRLAAVKRAIADGEARLGAAGRLVIRKSGTEPVIRVMAQGEDEELLASDRRRNLRGDPAPPTLLGTRQASRLLRRQAAGSGSGVTMQRSGADRRRLRFRRRRRHPGRHQDRDDARRLMPRRRSPR